MKGAAETATPAPLGRLSLLDHAACFLSSGLYLSHVPVKLFGGRGRRRSTGAGLVGTLWGWLLIPLVPTALGGFAVFYALALAVSIAVSDRAERAYGVKDDPRIVIDETVGYWAAAAFLPRTNLVLGACFVMFRIFDVSKLPPFKAFENLRGGLGVVLDDVAAGVAANLVVRLALRWI